MCRSSGDAQDAGRGNGPGTLGSGPLSWLWPKRLVPAAAQPHTVSPPAATFVKNAPPACSAIPLGLQQHFSNVRQQLAQVAGETGGLGAVVGAVIVESEKGRIRRGTICPSRHIGRSEAREKPRCRPRRVDDG